MTAEAETVLAGEGFTPDLQVLTRSVDVRYSGQEHSVTVPIPDGGGDVAAEVQKLFTELHERQYGHVMEDPIEVTTMRLRATGAVGKPTLPILPTRSGPTPAPEGHRNVHLSDSQPAVPYALYTREQLLAGDEINGPAVISEHTATTVIHAGDALRVGTHGEMVISIGTEGRA
jgi:N-methylhydantoinase A